MSCIVIYCRAGFENDAAAEITHHASQHGVGGYVKAKPNSALVVYHCYSHDEAEYLLKKIPFKDMVFARQWFVGKQIARMPIDDRVTSLCEAAKEFPLCGELRVETCDTNDGKELSKFCKKISTPLAKGLEKQETLLRQQVKNRPVLHVLFIASDTAYVGYSFSFNNSALYMGIPRLRYPKDAPSRSTLKLDEAFMVFVPEDEQEDRVRSGMKAVDLGACPGGWTYQLVRRGMFVQAIDNGPMDQALMESGQVKHYREDGFKFRPERRNIDWLVCDMVEKPSRVTELMIDWAVNGFAKELIFNLKLPMKKRFDCVYENMQRIDQELREYGVKFNLQAKHLYHDREEVTVHVQVLRVPQNVYS
ncbi:23S rRNA (cytidine(2498)-2'-O)-methyltransferase RlmM [Pseudoalteromonas sp. CnMc7-15]|uniref:23S rRNA (cytidine(2498)-2'-O)-methyltransferase RlmM n=1 Tax=unclassified Pseudoalteromonas TaxID=194690 RepID=UPI001EF41A64|nr:23S rRNA (cytidine(2498)-2'-O)-methyltransferase RlmM [Pseudoalteromonas sp. CnMc7-15]MCG7568288.1 23S rRNA (cytidine(2498)-2'-O)-methyltransferase RlmM [Pseudoalteromonas sp. CnMc7-15]